jgi:hypothetical protein
MGALPYWYFTKYDTDVDKALQALRQSEFAAGRYFPVTQHIHFPIDPSKQSTGAKHLSIDDAREAAGTEGTRSILDIDRVTQEPDFGAASPLDPATLEDLFGTTEPTRTMVESNNGFFARIERGQATYFVVFRNGIPNELIFAGYSYD